MFFDILIKEKINWFTKPFKQFQNLNFTPSKGMSVHFVQLNLQKRRAN